MLQRPAHLAHRELKKLDSFVGGLGIAQPPRISLKDDRFTVLDETGMTVAEPSLVLDVVIIDANQHASRILYDKTKPYDPMNTEAPICWSDNGVGPSKACQQPQAPTCAVCPNAVWGSAIGLGGKGIPACSTIKKLAVLVSGVDGVFLLGIPPGSLGAFKQYISELARMPASPEEVVTTLKMENKELQFSTKDWVPEGYIGYIEELIKNDDAASIVNRHDEARDPAEFRAAQIAQMQQNVAPQEQQAPALAPPTGVRRPPGRPPGSANKPKVLTPAQVGPPQVAPRLVEAAAGSLTRSPQGFGQQAPSQPAFNIAPGVVHTPREVPPQMGFGFGVSQAPQAPDPGVQGMLDRAFNLPRRA